MGFLEKIIDRLDIDAFSKDWLSQKPLLQMTREFQISDTRQVKRIAAFLGVPDRPEYKSKLTVYADEFCRLYNEGLTHEEIAMHLGLNKQLIPLWRKKLNLPARPQWGLQRLEYEKKMRNLENYIHSKGAVILEEAASDLSLSKEKIKNLRNSSEHLDYFILSLPSTTRIYYKTSDFFGDNIGKVILFRKGDWRALSQKIIEIIFPQVSRNLRGRDWQSVLRNRFKNNTNIPPQYVEAIINGLSSLEKDTSYQDKTDHKSLDNVDFSNDESEWQLKQIKDVVECLQRLHNQKFTGRDLLTLLRCEEHYKRRWYYSDSKILKIINQILLGYASEGKIKILKSDISSNFFEATHNFGKESDEEIRTFLSNTKYYLPSKNELVTECFTSDNVNEKWALEYKPLIDQYTILSIEDILEIFDKSDKLTHIKLISTILNIMDYSVLPKDTQLNTEIDLICKKNAEALIVSVKAYQQPTYTDIIIMSSLARKENAKALVITSQLVSNDLRQKSSDERVSIWDSQDLKHIVSELPSLPALESYLVKVKKGRFEGYCGIVTLLNFEKKKILVKILNYPHQPTVACSTIEVQPLNLKPNSVDYHDFASNMTSLINLKEDRFDKTVSMTDESEYNSIPLIVRYVSIIVSFDHSGSFNLIGSVDKSKIILRIDSNRIDVISCECLYFSDHWHERKLCRHLLAAVLRVDNNTTDKLLKILTDWIKGTDEY